MRPSLTKLKTAAELAAEAEKVAAEAIKPDPDVEERPDPSSGYPYYYNTRTGQSGWTREEVSEAQPVEEEEEPEDEEDKHEGEGTTSVSSDGKPLYPGEVAIHPLAHFVVGTEADAGYTYFNVLCNYGGPFVHADDGSGESKPSSARKSKVNIKLASADTVGAYAGLVLQHISASHPTKLLWEMLQVLCQHHGHLWEEEKKETTPQFGGGVSAGGAASKTPQAKAVAVLQRYVKQQQSAYPPPISAGAGVALLRVAGQAKEVVVPKLEAGDYESAWAAAVEAKEWSHALLIAATLGEETYSTTVKKYVASKFGAGHPMASLLLMATNLEPQLPGGESLEAEAEGKEAEGGEQKNKEEDDREKKLLVGQWAAHLVVILSQSKSHAAMAKASTALGQQLLAAAVDADKDADAGGSIQVMALIVGAHCCFIAAEKQLEPVSATASFVLLSGGGSKVRGGGMKMITAESVMLTELYEWAHHDRIQQQKKGPALTAAAATNFSGFQTFKLWFAGYLAEMGMLERSTKYITAIQHAFQSMDAAASTGFKQELAALYERIEEAQKPSELPPPEEVEKDDSAAGAAADEATDATGVAADSTTGKSGEQWDQSQAQWNEQTQQWDQPQQGQQDSSGGGGGGGGGDGGNHIEERTDPNSGTKYFYNKHTQASGWTREEVA
jgi:hypothetical protein